MPRWDIRHTEKRQRQVEGMVGLLGFRRQLVQHLSEINQLRLQEQDETCCTADMDVKPVLTLECCRVRSAPWGRQSLEWRSVSHGGGARLHFTARESQGIPSGAMGLPHFTLPKEQFEVSRGKAPKQRCRYLIMLKVTVTWTGPAK